TFVFVCSGLMFMLYSWTPHVTEKYIASFIIIVLGIYNINLPFHSGYPAVVPVNYTIGLILQSTLGILLLIIHFKKGRFSLARQEAHYRLLVENAAGIILLYIYAERRFRYVSPSVRDEMGVSEGSLGHDAFSLLEGIEGDGAARMRELLEAPPEGSVNFIFSKRFSETQSKWFEIYATPVEGDTATTVGVECIISNITARMDMLESLKRTEQSRKELVEDISHELRTPLTIIQGYTETLLKDSTEDAVRVYLEIIDAKARTLNTLLEDLIQTSLFSSRRAEYKFYEAGAREYLEQLANEIRLRVESEGRRFRCDNSVPSDTLMVIDKSRVDQVVSNIVSNALESTSRGDAVEFISYTDAAAAESGTDGRVLICVRDSGRGIPEGELGNIFRRRYSGLSHTDGEGHGLGLYISREIVEQHGGQIWAENNNGKGASFCFYLPCYKGGAS
ncbi:MAG: HAMP domain-containing histidine kinase, partial [Clostridiales Family XIII bacterium]|nr:HAMP domain-containing histidine kinase [Clostridiales Family XIII bacterium]